MFFFQQEQHIIHDQLPIELCKFTGMQIEALMKKSAVFLQFNRKSQI